MSKSIKSFLIIFFIVTPFLRAQYFGASIGYATINAPFGDIFYEKNVFSYHLGITYQSSDAKGKEVATQKSNYGRTVVGTGSYLFTIDLGLGYFISENVKLNGELSFGSKKFYTNYSDQRFTDDGYHMINRTESVAGFGISAGLVVERIQLFTGYNSLREFGIGLRMVWE